MLDVSHNYLLVAASLAIAMMAGFTGLSLTKGASTLDINTRKRNISLAAISLGGGIWSMHFVAMLGMELPIDFYYDPLITLLSALIAVLVVGVALLLLHFKTRTNTTITIAGAIVGAGILAMHYIGMSGIQRCLPLYTVSGIAIAIVSSIGLSICALWLAYGQRTHRNIVLGTIFFGFAVFAVHFVALAGTSFIAHEAVANAERFIDNDTLALLVAIGAFVICGAFLLNSVTFLNAEPREALADNGQSAENLQPSPLIETPPDDKPKQLGALSQVPFERNGRTYFIGIDDIAVVRAEGHYTIIYSQSDKHFCPWSISEASKRLPASSFVRTHRSYLINPAHVSGFERKKDNGVCYFENTSSLSKVPVSRSRLSAVRDSLGLA